MNKKLITLICCVFVFVVSPTFAGSDDSIKYKKGINSSVVSDYFSTKQFQVDLFGNYTHDSKKLGDGTFGGGLGVNYFVTRNLGLGADGYLLNNDDTSGQLAGTVRARFPIANNFAPYTFAGGGAVFNGKDRKNVQPLIKAGAGVEYRFTQRVGLMTDYSWNVVEGSNNNFGMIRSGINISF